MLPCTGIIALQGSSLHVLGGVLQHAARAFSTAAAAPAAPAAEKKSYGGLKDQDRIFQNIYGRHDISIKVSGHCSPFSSFHPAQCVSHDGGLLQTLMLDLEWSCRVLSPAETGIAQRTSF